MTVSLYYIPPIVTLFLAVYKFIPPLTSRKIVFALSLICLGAFQYIRAYFIVHDIPLSHSALGLPFYSSIGLLVYCYSMSITEYASRYSLRLMLFFLPGAVSLVGVGAFILISPEKFYMLIHYPQWNFWLRFVVTLSWAYSAFWVVSAFRIVYIMIGRRNLARPPYNIFIVVTLISLPLIITGSISNIFNYNGRSPISIVYYALMAFFALLTNGLAERYPNVMLNRRTPYPFYYRGEVPVDYRQQEKIVKQLKLYMAEEKPYCDESFSMEALSKKLNITQRQLSRIINDKYGQNFNSYINRYRTEEVKRLLSLPGAQNLLNVSLQAGFNSYSVFYSSFKKYTGMTPRQYLRRQSAESAGSSDRKRVQ